ncbi:hypothetical protein H5395_18135 [Paracoccus sp. MC1854]|uniref:hypothetical protein n=1 Tax=Paracoccus sp. MC1854 TaxID=2760306 RepID=UPI0016030EDF|nr:hypothetical protein [Paracoccus sp. MC1854]MBB1493356.1 hypothetical protein [Paracoccus sp. MC1854]
MFKMLRKFSSSPLNDVAENLVGSPNISHVSSENVVLQAGNYTVEGYFFGQDRLVVSFEPDTDKKPGTELRPGWGSTVLRKSRISHICVKPAVSDWYQGAELAGIFGHLQERISGHSRIVTYGASMGGFAALAYADLLGAHEIYAFDPQSTLHRPDVPWEKRFIKALPLDFTGPYGSANGKFTIAEKAYIFLDWHTLADRLHAEALAADNVEFINVPYTGHSAAYAATASGVMKYIIRGVMFGNLDKAAIYRDMHHGRRKVDRYATEMKKRVAGRPLFEKIVAKSLS